MATLAEIKGAEVQLRQILAQGHISGCVEDMVWAYKETKTRRRLAERKAGIRGVALFLCIALAGCEPPVETRTPAEAISANVSAYCPCSRCCGKYSDGITANGYRIQPGDKFCAADKRFPFGTVLDIPGYGKVPVLDRGGAIKGNKLDVYFPTHQEALNFGRQYLTVKVERVSK